MAFRFRGRSNIPAFTTIIFMQLRLRSEIDVLEFFSPIFISVFASFRLAIYCDNFMGYVLLRCDFCGFSIEHIYITFNLITTENVIIRKIQLEPLFGNGNMKYCLGQCHQFCHTHSTCVI